MSLPGCGGLGLLDRSLGKSLPDHPDKPIDVVGLIKPADDPAADGGEQAGERAHECARARSDEDSGG